MKHSFQATKIVRSVALFVTTLAFVPVAALAQSMMLYTGSDTVQPMVDAALSSFVRGHAAYKPKISGTGTSVGFKELCAGRTVMAGASRAIKAVESKACATAGIQLIEIPVALDAVEIVVSTKNTWLKDLTLAELTSVFDPASAGKLVSWKQVRPSFPDMPIKTAGVDIKHATFSFFTESIGLNGFIRSDYKDFKEHALAGNYIAGDAAALGFIPIGDAKAMEGQIRPIGVNFGAGAVIPSAEEVSAGKYDKLSRTVYLYVNTAALAKSSTEDVAFTQMMVKDMEKFVRFVNLVPLRSLQYQENMKRLAASGK